MDASHEFVEHTSEIGVRLRARSFPELIAEAGRALAELQLRGQKRGLARSKVWRTVEVRAHDDVSLIVDWLNELLFLGETEYFVATDFEVMPIEADARDPSRRRLHARVLGVALEKDPARVKAATFHGLSVQEVGSGLEAELVLDV